MPNVIAIIVSIFALLYLTYQIEKKIKPLSEGDSQMRKISGHIRAGAMTFLKREYRHIAVFVVVVAILLGIFTKAGMVWSYILGSVFSMLAGYLGMRASTLSNSRCANQAKDKGLDQALDVAYAGGSVMGLAVTGLGLLGTTICFLATGASASLVGYSLGASSVALFARVGGGIYTKAADMGADLVGKVEVGIDEDDPRNPAVIADNVGDNVGDVAGMGADLFESYCGAVISSLLLGQVYYGKAGTGFPIAIAGVGLLATIAITVYFGRVKHSRAGKPLSRSIYLPALVVMIFSFILSQAFFKEIGAGISIVSGIIVGILIGLITEFYTSDKHRPVRDIAKSSEAGTATNIIFGLSTGMASTALPIFFIAIAIVTSYFQMGVYGIALAAVGMLSITGSTVTVDALGPIADNAGGVAEMSGLEKQVRQTTDQLDSVGNTTAAVGKGFAVGSAALTALSLFVSYTEAVQVKTLSILDPRVVAGLFVGGVFPFLFSALTMRSVGKTAFDVIQEVRRQFHNIPGILEGTAEPDYTTCIDLATKASIREMVGPGFLALVGPILAGILFGPEMLGGLLVGSLVTGVLMASFMSNAGGGWDNAKKYIESGQYGGQGSPAHKASVVGDTVGDPLKDTSGPSLNILIKLMSVVALVFAGFFV